MGYLDKQSRVIDVTLTERGRALYASGQLDFAFFGLFDDQIDYDPVKATGSFSDEEREAQLEATPILEPSFIKETRGTTSPLEPLSHIFTAGAGYVEIPTMQSPLDGDALSLRADQRRDGSVYHRSATNLAQIDLSVIGDVERGDHGFIVRVLSSGSNGLQPVSFRRDLFSRRSVDSFVGVSIDDEAVIDLPLIKKPQSVKIDDRSTRKR